MNASRPLPDVTPAGAGVSGVASRKAQRIETRRPGASASGNRRSLKRIEHALQAQAFARNEKSLPKHWYTIDIVLTDDFPRR